MRCGGGIGGRARLDGTNLGSGTLEKSRGGGALRLQGGVQGACADRGTIAQIKEDLNWRLGSLWDWALCVCVCLPGLLL